MEGVIVGNFDINGGILTVMRELNVSEDVANKRLNDFLKTYQNTEKQHDMLIISGEDGSKGKVIKNMKIEGVDSPDTYKFDFMSDWCDINPDKK